MIAYANKGKPDSAASWGFEWKTEANLLGLPYIHIAMGRDRQSGKILVAKGVIAIGQFAIGKYVLAQAGFGEHVWSLMEKSPQAVEYFKHFLQ